MSNEQFIWTIYLIAFVALLAHTVNVITDPNSDKDE